MVLVSILKMISCNLAWYVFLFIPWGGGFVFCSGLAVTYMGLYLMNGHGQPALLYLVPCTLGTYLLLAPNIINYWIIHHLQLHCYFIYIYIYDYDIIVLTICDVCIIIGLSVLLSVIRGELRVFLSYGNGLSLSNQRGGEA